MAMQLGNNAIEHNMNMNKVLTLADGTKITMKEIQDLINKNGGDNIPYLNSYIENALFIDDILAISEIYNLIKS